MAKRILALAAVAILTGCAVTPSPPANTIMLGPRDRVSIPPYAQELYQCIDPDAELQCKMIAGGSRIADQLCQCFRTRVGF